MVVFCHQELIYVALLEHGYNDRHPCLTTRTVFLVHNRSVGSFVFDSNRDDDIVTVLKIGNLLNKDESLEDALAKKVPVSH